MDSFRKVFPHIHTFLPVVHVQDDQQALRNVNIAMDNGADGVFLINHNFSDKDLIRCYETLIPKFPRFWIGLNCLVSGNMAINFLPKTCAGLWVDNAGIAEEYGHVSTTQVANFKNIRERSDWNGLYFGGVAFKYQKPVINLAGVTKAAIPFVDAIITSGDGTGFAPDLEKMLVMRKASGTHPLVIASGITPENVRMYMPHADGFLVASGISNSHTELNPVKVKQLSKILGK